MCPEFFFSVRTLTAKIVRIAFCIGNHTWSTAGHDSSLTETEAYEHLPDPQVYLDDSLTEAEDQAYSPPLAKRMKMGGMSNDNQV